MAYLFGSRDRHLRVLMYHKVTAGTEGDFLTIPISDLEAQFRYIREQDYTSILLSDLINYTEGKQALPPRPLLITFDDGYRDNYTLMYPLLARYGLKANIFLVPSFLQDGYQSANDQYLRVEDIRAMNPLLVEFGLHSFDHKSYKTLPWKEVDTDIGQTKAALITMGIPFQPCLAYPYGAFPKKNPVARHELFKTLQMNNIVLAFRIGNRLNPLPLRNPFLIQRLDIRGNESFKKFVRLLKKGKSLI